LIGNYRHPQAPKHRPGLLQGIFGLFLSAKALPKTARKGEKKAGIDYVEMDFKQR